MIDRLLFIINCLSSNNFVYLFSLLTFKPVLINIYFTFIYHKVSCDTKYF